MELGSGSSSNSSSSSSSDSLNGLKFGKKIYFEDVNGNVPVGSSSPVASGGKPPPVPAKKGKVGVGPGGGQAPRCQVEGCKVDLSDAKAYYSRHKVCAMHSKYGTVIVNGLQQRFCQQCSRFHLLSEFDDGKRSCRRRLAGHNERRRKPPPGSLLSSRFGSLSSPFLAESSGRGGSFLLDFSKYPALTGRDSWTGTKTPERSLGHQQTTVAKFPPNMWHCNPENSPSEMLIQGSTARSSYSDIPSGECFTGVSDCSRALSLLSNQPWGSRDRSSSLGINNFVNANGTPMVQSMGSHCDSIDGFSSPFWGFKGSECNGGSHEMPPDLGLGQTSQPASNHYSGDLDVAQQTERDYLMLEHSRGYDSSVQNMHWSL